jgi:hypothetical protein
VVAATPESRCYQRLNWLTNFSLSANEVHSQPKMNPWLLKILETCEIEVPKIKSAEPLLIPISQWLPADWLITVPYRAQNSGEFFKNIQNVWEQFQKPSLRIFLPPEVSIQDWEAWWNKQNLSTDVAIVCDNP